MIWVKQRGWKRIYMIGLARRGSLLPSLVQAASCKLRVTELGTDLEVSVALVWDELIYELVVEIETCTTSMHPSSVFHSQESKNQPTDLR